MQQELLKMRKQKGYTIAQTMQIKRKGNKRIVPSQTSNKKYEVILYLDKKVCTCPDYTERQMTCKHIFAVQMTITKEMDGWGNVKITQTKRITYPQDWANYDKAQTQQKELFMKLLFGLCNSMPEEPKQVHSGRPALNMKDMVFASALKIFTTFSLRRFNSDMKTAMDLGYIERMPHFALVSVYMNKPELTQILNDLITMSALPLKSIESSFGVDASGFSPSKFSRWFSHKWGKETDRKIWYKLSVVNGNATHTITACEITTAYVNDTMMLPQLVSETSKKFNVQEIVADKGYLSDANLVHLDRLGITGYIPFKANSKRDAQKRSDIWKNAYNYFTYHQSAFMRHYNQRSNTETCFHMIKSKFGDSVRSKNEIACVNEILLKVLCHNICVLISEMFELGIEPKFLGV